jgi:hypothetical protein
MVARLSSPHDLCSLRQVPIRNVQPEGRSSARLISAFGVVLLVSVIASISQSHGQISSPQNATQQDAQSAGGNSTGGTFAPVYDPEHRPITAGGFVNDGPRVFEDVTKKAGLSEWRHVMGTPEKKFIIETDGSGVGLIDYDNDGWLDIYLVNGSTYGAMDGKEEPPHAALFHNNHDGTFSNVAAKA